MRELWLQKEGMEIGIKEPNHNKVQNRYPRLWSFLKNNSDKDDYNDA